MKSPIRASILIVLFLVGGFVAGWVIISGSRDPVAEPSVAAKVQERKAILPTTPARVPASVALPQIGAGEVDAKPSPWPDDIESRIYEFFANLRDVTVHVEAVHCKGPECQIRLTTEDTLAGRQRLREVINALLRSPSIAAGSMLGKGVESLYPGLLQQEIVLFSPSVKFSM